MMSPEDVAKIAAALFGSTGLGAIAIAWLSLKTEAAKGRRGDPDGRQTATAFQCGAKDEKAFEALTNAITTLTTVALKAVAIMEKHESEEQRRQDLRTLAAEFAREHGREMSPREQGSRR